MSTKENAELIANTAKAFEAITPLLGPYGPAVLLGLRALEFSAPLVYERVVALIAKGDVTQVEADELKDIITRLKNPGDYFADQPA